MKKTIIEMQQIEKIESIICDCCKVEYDDPMELQEFLCHSDRGGYASIFGDTYLIEIDLCQFCIRDILEKHLRVLKPPTQKR